jgi:hypothetical protein
MDWTSILFTLLAIVIVGGTLTAVHVMIKRAKGE